MHRSVTSRRPAGAPLHEIGVGDFSDQKITGSDIRPLNLCVTFEAQVIVTLDQKLAIDRAMRVMASGASIAQGFVFEDERPALLSVALRSTLIQPGHSQSARRFHNVVPVRIVAIHAIHPPFNHRMMLRQVKFSVDIQVALKAGFRRLPQIDNRALRATGLVMDTSRAVTRFAADVRRVRPPSAFKRAGEAVWRTSARSRNGRRLPIAG